MAGILDYLQYALGKLFYRVRGHDAKQFIKSAAFKDLPDPNMTLEAPECGPTGSTMLDFHTCLAEDSKGRFPELHWNAPPHGDVREYVLVCEDIDPPIPFLVINHGLFYGIPPTTTAATHADIKQNRDLKDQSTHAGWKYVPNLTGNAYIGPAPPLGHGAHRYIFTIIALNEPLPFGQEDQVTKQKIKEAMTDKVIGWGQWVGLWERPWPK
ncbi:YbhB/YbcL family Raf kinase inhibitor-like protein [Aspergillus clavatus NRRL 1]|uniref:Uncharacterized protein n=1 Tax=Aspergillus clavatus (strain ATCC 1007 / CBS 513.65 / DSM 816 / NCTC 3887 / NRRL 1 / QM 1276 / 107) TaxID=344612 RepID=A1C7M2_ASPCL|nr:uncharacterized protein ACLA_074300 [Aspergillus clavatus NRRL 1]EAW14393.1 conserved hypothetical protein [Aspergillus clavatus NRRL 1]